MTGRTPKARRPILLIGKTGQIGWELERALAPLAPVVALSRRELDLTDTDAIRRRVRETAPGLIVNAAAYTAVDAAEEEPALAMAVNGTAPGVLAEEAKRLDVPLVHYSTDFVFDGRGGPGPAPRPYTESDAPAPINEYGRTKLAGERAIQAVAPAHLILRTSWIYGNRGRNFLRTIRRLAAERDELEVVDDQIGSPTWARAVADATAQILARGRPPATGAGLAEAGGLYHLSAAGSTSWCGFAAAIVQWGTESGRAPPRMVPIPTGAYPAAAARPAYSVLDNGAIAKAFGIALADWESQLRLCMTEGAQTVRSRRPARGSGTNP